MYIKCQRAPKLYITSLELSCYSIICTGRWIMTLIDSAAPSIYIFFILCRVQQCMKATLILSYYLYLGISLIPWSYSHVLIHFLNAVFLLLSILSRFPFYHLQFVYLSFIATILFNVIIISAQKDLNSPHQRLIRMSGPFRLARWVLATICTRTSKRGSIKSEIRLIVWAKLTMHRAVRWPNHTATTTTTLRAVWWQHTFPVRSIPTARHTRLLYVALMTEICWKTDIVWWYSIAVITAALSKFH